MGRYWLIREGAGQRIKSQGIDYTFIRLLPAMNTDKNNADSWTPCAPGTLSTYARQAKTKRRKQRRNRAAGISAAILCVVLAGIWGANSLTFHREHYFGGIACSEVRANVPAYSMGGLPTELRNRITDHLKQCPACQQFMRQMGTSAAHRSESGCSCAACRQLAQRTKLLEKSHPTRSQNSSRAQFALIADAR